MKIILREHVDHLGERGQVVTVAAGYARNFLVPKGLAYTATPGNMKQLESERRVWEAKESKEVQDAKAMADRLAAVELSVTKKAGQTGTLYGSVTNVELAELLAAKGIEIDRRIIQLSEPIKTLGAFEVPVKLHRQVPASIKVEVLTEGGSKIEPVAPQPEEKTASDDDGAADPAETTDAADA